MFAYICYLKCIQRDTARHSNSLGWRTREVSVLQSKPYDFLGEVLDLFLPTSELQAPGFPFGACPSTNTGASIETPSRQGCCLHGSSCCRFNASRNPDELRWALTQKWGIIGGLQTIKGQSLFAVSSVVCSYALLAKKKIQPDPTEHSQWPPVLPWASWAPPRASSTAEITPVLTRGSQCSLELPSALSTD